MGSHGMSIDIRHVMFLADLITFKGRKSTTSRKSWYEYRSKACDVVS